jgi:hypothetical protein
MNTRTSDSLPSLRRLLVVSILLPAAVVASNMILLYVAPHKLLRSSFYPWMVFSVAVLSWSAGRFVRPAWLCWVVFVWSLVLLDMLTIAVCLAGPVDRSIGYVLVSAQIGLVVLWAILGSGHWQLRLPAAIAAIPVVNLLAANLGGTRPLDWDSVLFVSTGVMTALCGGLRYLGFAILQEDSATTSPTNRGKRPAVQFGVKHMLIWLTVTGPLLLVLRSINLGGETNFSIALIAVSVATLNLISIWAVLGGGPALLRIACLVAVPLGIAWGLNAYSAHLKTVFTSSPRTQVSQTIYAMIHMHGRWTSWFWLAAALLDALLMFLRARGYRLLRTRRA